MAAHTSQYYVYEDDHGDFHALRVRDDYATLGGFSTLAAGTGYPIWKDRKRGSRPRRVTYVNRESKQRATVAFQAKDNAGFTTPAEITINDVTFTPISRLGESMLLFT